MILLDTDIAIDILRKHPPAIQWITSMQDPLCLPGLVALELYQGCHNKRETEKLEKELAKFAVLWPANAACAQVLAVYATAHLAFATGILDALIAATGITHGLKLHTFNQKHFAPFPQLVTVQPYVR